MPLLGLYSWSQYTLPAGLPPADLTADTHPNDPTSPVYDVTQASWLSQDFTFDGGAPTTVDIIDDDLHFDDGYVDTGTPQTLTSEVTIDGTVYAAGSTVENEFSLVNAFGQEIYVVSINGVNVGFAYADGEAPTIGETFTATQGLDGAPADNADGISSSSEPYANIICFAAGTLIDTPSGPKAVETLTQGDFVKTADHGGQAILWRRISPQSLDGVADDAKPVLIAAGALGNGIPSTDLIVSPQHRILVGGAQLGAIFGDAALVPAKALTQLPGIRFMQGRKSVDWVHFACARHEVVTANGCLSESLLLGQMVMNGFSGRERADVAAIFGPMPRDGAALNGFPARELLSVQKGREAVVAFKRAQRAALMARVISHCGPKTGAGRMRRAA